MPYLVRSDGGHACTSLRAPFVSFLFHFGRQIPSARIQLLNAFSAADPFEVKRIRKPNGIESFRCPKVAREAPRETGSEWNGRRSQNRNSINLKNEFVPWNETAKVGFKLPKAKLASFELKSWIVTFARCAPKQRIQFVCERFCWALSRRQNSLGPLYCFVRDAKHFEYVFSVVGSMLSVQ